MLLKKEITIRNTKGNLKDNLLELQYALEQLKKGKIRIVLEVEEDEVARAKKRYFAMVHELGLYAGYQSHEEREIFKEEVKKALGNESLSEMTSYDQVRIKIEELHKLAAEHYNFTFKIYDTDIVQFDNAKDIQQQPDDREMGKHG